MVFKRFWRSLPRLVPTEIQNENANITTMRYFDKGSEIRINGEIDQLLNLPASPMNLMAVGSARPLSRIHIPGLADFDAAIGALQHDAFCVQITGPLNQPQRKQVPFADIGQDMKNFLFGDIQAANE